MAGQVTLHIQGIIMEERHEDVFIGYLTNEDYTRKQYFYAESKRHHIARFPNSILQAAEQ